MEDAGAEAAELRTGATLARRLAAALGLPADLRDVDKYRMQADPALLRDVVSALAAMLPPETEVLVGLELGGVPLAVALALHTGLPAAILRRTGRPGVAGFVAGAPVTGRRAVLIADMVQGAGKLVPAANELRDNHAVVDHALVAVCWLPQAFDTARQAGLQLLAAVTPGDIEAALRPSA